MRRVVTAREMRAIDAHAINEHGIEGFALMSAAGEAVSEHIQRYFEISGQEPDLVVFLCGKGNNGGDGFVAAAELREEGITCMPILLGARKDELTGDAALALRTWTEAGGEVQQVTTEKDWQRVFPLVEEADLLVDAMLGTGAHGPLSGMIALAAESLDQVWAPVIAVDMPTGVDADSGELQEGAVFCDLTVTFGLPKRGQLTFPGKSYCGRVEVVDIGIPPELQDGVIADPQSIRVEMSEYSDLLLRLPVRGPDIHKGDRGRLLMLGGSPGLTGAMALCSEAAVRAGAGLVTLGIPESLMDIMEIKTTEAMCLALPETQDRALDASGAARVREFQSGRVSAWAMGPGAGRAHETQELFRHLVTDSQLPMVIDADAIHAFSDHHVLLKNVQSEERPVLTPHWGEFLALTRLSPEAAAEADRLALAAEWAQELNVVLVLKGAPTLIADPTGSSVVINSTGCEALATGGSGDVLTGIIAGFLAQKKSSFDAAVAGVYLHGYLADYLTEETGSGFGHKAGDFVSIMPQAFGSLFP